MAKYREEVCKFYNCEGNCQAGREANHYGYCQRCRKYEARAHEKHINKKKLYNEKQCAKLTDY